MDVYEQAAEFRRQLQQRETAAVREIAATYQHAAERVTDRVADLERRIADRMHAGPVPVSWLWGAGRLQDTLTDIEATVAGWANGPARAVAAAAVDAEAGIGPTVAMELVRARLNVTDSVARSLVRLRPDEVEQITGTLRPGAPLDRLFHRVAREQADQVRDALIAGVASNQDPRVIARSIAPLVDGGLTRARTITRTELLRTSREAQRQAWLRKPGLVSGWRWWSTLDRTACPVCWAMHGTLHQLDEPFGTHPNCIPAGAVVSGPAVTGSTARWYEGDVIDLATASGNLLTVTPNHPVLTAEGWVAAGNVGEGDYVVSCTATDLLAVLVDPDDHQAPSLIEDVAVSPGGALPVAAVSVPVATEDFHGDGPGSEVCVVRTNRQLGRETQSTFEAMFAKPDLCIAHAQAALLSGSGATFESFERVDVPPPTGLSERCEAAVLLSAASRCEKPVRVSAAANLDAVISQEAGNGRATDVVELRQLRDRLSRVVAFDKVVGAVRKPFRGHVYNLETRRGWYVAQGILTHNCRCSQIPELLPASETGVPLQDLPAPETGEDRFAGLPFTVQRRILGPGKHDAYLRGDITLPDVVRFRRDPTWGPTRSEAPLPPHARPARTPPASGRTMQERAPEVTFTTDIPTPPATRPSSIVDVFPARSGVKATVRANITRALGILDRLFTGLPVGMAGKAMPVTYSSTTRRSSVAFYGMRMNAVTRDFVRSEINMSARYPDQAAGTFLHEFGHFMDFELFDGTSPTPATSVTGAGDLEEWRAAVVASNGYQAIKAHPGLDGWYFLKPTEVFARSFAQWSALRSGDGELLRSVVEDTWAGHIAQGAPNPQWDDPRDFHPIAVALDTLFRKKGWMT